MESIMRGAVVSPEPRAAEIGADVLRVGGNAFDAAIAAGFAQMVFSPFACGLGGWGMATLFDAKRSTTAHLGFSAKVGSTMYPEVWADDILGYTDMWHVALLRNHKNLMGYSSIMTPGVVAGLGEMHRRYGSKPWAELLQPSIDASNEGFPFPEQVASVSRSFVLPGMPSIEDHYCWSEPARELWIGADGGLKKTGDQYCNPDQAKTLKRLADFGAQDFYTGELSRIIIDDFEKNGAYVTAEDLNNYEVEVSDTLVGSYRGLRVESSALPNGGLLTLHILKVLERFELEALEHNGPDHAFLVSAAMAWAGVIRFRYLADPKYHDVPVEWLLSDEYSDEVADHIRKGRFPNIDVLQEPSGTTHLNVVDAEGNCVSMTQTLSLPSGVVIPGTGFTWNACTCLMDPEPGRVNSLIPGRSRANAAAPTILFKDGRPFIVIGAPGGYSVSSAITQAIINIVDFKMTSVEAASAARFHSEGATVFAEGRTSQRTVRALESRGVPIELRPSNYIPTFGRVQIIQLQQGRIDAAADPREDGGVPILV